MGLCLVGGRSAANIWIAGFTKRATLTAALAQYRNFAMSVVKSLRARRESKRGLSVDSALALKSHQIVKIRLAGRVYDMAA